MTVRGEALAALTGSWLLARRQPAGLAFFNDSRAGFVRSFWAVALAAPFELGLQALVGDFALGADLLRALIVLAVALVADAVAFPLLMAPITTELGCGDRWVLFVVAYNWSGLLRIAIFTPVALLTLLVPALHPLLITVMVLLLAYQAYVAHVSLAVSPLTAGGTVLLAVLVDTVIGLVAARLF